MVNLTLEDDTAGTPEAMHEWTARLHDFDASAGERSRIGATYQTSQTGHPGNRICQVVASQNFVSEDVVAYCDTALITK